MTIGYFISRGLHKLLKLNMVRDSSISKKAKLGYDVQVVNSSIERYSYIGEHSCLIYTDVGSFCSIADRCIIGGPAHALNFVSTSPVFNQGRNIFNHNLAEKEFSEYKKTTIENDVWIGSGALVKAGITIGTGAVIGMGSVVTHDVGAYEIWAGNPAKLIRPRFSSEICERLLKTQWWEFSDEQLVNLGYSIDDPVYFCEEVEKQNGKV